VSTTPDAVTQVRAAVRAALADVDVPPLVAVSGGADSLALASAACHRSVCRSLPVYAAVVDHGLQPGSADQAARTSALLEQLGLRSRVCAVRVDGPGGMEAAARRARYQALREARPTEQSPVLLGHTLDDQAETVLLGLGRGSGARSIAGMRRWDPPWLRPLLGVRRATTRAACAALDLPVWDDPHNSSPRFTRVRLRGEALPLLEDILAGGVAEALARTAAQLREDSEALDEIAQGLLAAASRADGAGTELDTRSMAAHPASVRRRVLRCWLTGSGVRDLTDAHLRRADALISTWRGQGAVAVPGGVEVARRGGRLVLDRRG
jgi:tRNA(Ile)-lysidine synthase